MGHYMGDTQILKPTQLSLESHDASRQPQCGDEYASNQRDNEVKLQNKSPHGGIFLGHRDTTIRKCFREFFDNGYL